ncbi:MAG: tetratricopeptide repeat protein [Magnetococcales bacterium]|nr:tetratricopeptide repeat protein [Magnetococcales bacterium]
MAQIDNIFEEIDEQMDADKAHKFFKENQTLIIGSLVLLFVGLFAFVAWRDARIKENQSLSDQYIQAQELETKGDRAGAKAIFQAIIKENGDHGYGLLSLLSDAQALAKAGKNDDAIASFEAIAAKTTNSPLQGMALLNAAYLSDNDDARAKGFLAKIDAASSFRPHALELEGLLLARAGDEKEAYKRYQEAIQAGASGQLEQRLKTRIERLAGKY